MFWYFTKTEILILLSMFTLTTAKQLYRYCAIYNIRDINNIVAMTRDFNIRNSNWDSNFYYHSIYTEDLLIIDSLGLELSLLSNPGPTRYINNPHDANSILDLVFL